MVLDLCLSGFMLVNLLLVQLRMMVITSPHKPVINRVLYLLIRITWFVVVLLAAASTMTAPLTLLKIVSFLSLVALQTGAIYALTSPSAFNTSHCDTRSRATSSQS